MHYHIVLSTLLIALAHTAPAPDLGATDLNAYADSYEVADLDTNNPPESFVQDTHVAPVENNVNLGTQIEPANTEPVEGFPYPAPAAFKCSSENSGSKNFCGYHHVNYWVCDRGIRHVCFYVNPVNPPDVRNKICAKTDLGQVICVFYTKSQDNTPISQSDDDIWQPRKQRETQGESPKNSPGMGDNVRCLFQSC